MVIDDDQLDQLRLPTDRALCLEHFFDADSFDPALFAGRSLHVVPDGAVAAYPYAVVCEALRERRKWAVGRVVMSGHRRLVLVRPAGHILAMHVLHFPTQVRSSAGYDVETRTLHVSAAEKELAGKLIDANTDPVDWSVYQDDRAAQLATLVQAALEKRPPTTVAAEPVPMLPLLEALQKSVAAALRKQTPESTAILNGASHSRTRNPKRPLARRRA